MRHDTRPRPSRRLPGGRQGAGVCAGADLGTVGGSGLGQYRVRAVWHGRDGGRRGQAWSPREDTRGLEPHPRGAAGKLTCGGRGPRWFFERVDLSLCPVCLLPASHVGKLSLGRSRARPLGLAARTEQKLSRGAPCAHGRAGDPHPPHPRGGCPCTLFSRCPHCFSPFPLLVSFILAGLPDG